MSTEKVKHLLDTEEKALINDGPPRLSNPSGESGVRGHQLREFMCRFYERGKLSKQPWVVVKTFCHRK